MTRETDLTKKNDTLYPQACQIVRSTGNTLISNLQRVLQIGYNRAARLIEAMESDGIVSPCDLRGMRKLLAGQATRPGEHHGRDWVRGYYCAVAALLSEKGVVTTEVQSLFQQGGSPELADPDDKELFVAHGLINREGSK